MENYFRLPKASDCDAAITKLLGGDRALCLEDKRGTTCTGRQDEIPASVVLETTSGIYLVARTCDVCEDLVACNKATSRAFMIKSEHHFNDQELKDLLTDECDLELPLCQSF